jgi:hypothetical protein
MKFGNLKSKIETILIESYKDKSFKDEMFIFDQLVLKNKNINKLYYLYDELNSNKGLSESVGNEYINQSIILYENIVNKINPKHIKEIEIWVSHIQCENVYSHIDTLFSNNIKDIENKIHSKNMVLEHITKSPSSKNDIVKIPIKTMVSIANKTITNYINTLSESDQKELKNLLSSDENTLKENYISLKENVISKLETLQENDKDEEVIEKINETINKIKNESFDRIGYFKLQKLNENL